MKRLIVTATIVALGCLSTLAATIQENVVFPDMNTFISQQVDESTAGIRDIANPVEAHVGQTFILTNSTTLRAITVKSHNARTWNSGDDVIELWIGEDTDPNPTNFVAGSTNLLTTIDMGGVSVVEGNYYTINLDSDLVLPSGQYAYQFRWTSTQSSHQWFLRRANTNGDYDDGGLLYVQETDGSSIDFPFSVTAGFANDMVFGLHSAVVGTVPSFTADLDEITMLIGPSDNQATGTVAVAYTADSTMDIEISISEESHPGSFSVLSATPQTLTDPAPSNTVLSFEFDNTVSNLVAGEIATGLVTIAWSETGSGTTNELEIPIIANTGFAPDANNTFITTLGAWGNAANWTFDRVPGELGADRAIIQQAGRVCNVETNFTGVFPYKVWVRTASGETSVLNIGADLKGSAEIHAGQANGQYGIINQTNGTVGTASVKVGSAATVASNSYYNLTSGTLVLDEMTATRWPITITTNGMLVIAGGDLTMDLASVNGTANLSGGGTISLESGSVQFTNGVATSVTKIDTPIAVSGGTLTLNGQPRYYSEFKVIGSDATIFSERMGTYGAACVFIFELDESGVSTINSTGYQSLTNAQLIVDGSNYTGGSTAEPIKLFNSNNLNSMINAANITITNFAEGVTAIVTQDQGNNEITLSITVPGYSGWIGGYGIAGSPDADWDNDFDSDGYINFYEYAFGGNPAEITSTPNAPTSTAVEDGGTTYFEYVYARRIAADELDYEAVFSTDLVITNWSGADVVEFSSGAIDSEYEAVTNRVDTAGKPVGFMQVNVEEL